MKYIKNAKLVLENGIVWDGALLIDGDRIAACGKETDLPVPEGVEIIDAQGSYVGPGFVNIHVHGGDVWSFYDHPMEAAHHFLSKGDTTILGALYYDLSKEDFVKGIHTIRSAMKNPGAGKALKGIYMEGPYMNPKYGARSEQNKWKGLIRAEDFKQIVDEAGLDAKVWAVAPEREGVEDFMQYARQVNPTVMFSVGHSEATPTQIRRVRRYGLHLQTHCMDATGQNVKWAGTRGSGPDEACLLDPDMYAEIISDSGAVHVNAELQRMIIRNKGIDRVVLITDSFVSFEESPEELKYLTDLVFDANRGLNGSKLTMSVAARNIMTHTNCGIAQAFLMASRNPARVIGMDDEIGTIEPGKRADLVFVNDRMDVSRVMLNGEFYE